MNDVPSQSVIVPVSLGERAYEIHVGPGLIERAGGLIGRVLPQPRVVVVSDETVARLHLAPLEASLTKAGIAHDRVVVPAGEGSKEFGPFARLIEGLLDAGLERRTTLVALGGGVVGDLTGFAASVLLRGVPFVQIPTTLLAQVDSSVGGKTGINTRHGKNLVGSFYQPRLVLADTGTLDTLPRRELLAGYAEVVKYGIIGDAPFFSWLEAHGPGLLAKDGAERRRAVEVSCRAKAAIVAADERETGDRALLNFGHTFAHALEAETGYSSDLLHGEAVAVGMVMALTLSARLGLCEPAAVERVRRHLSEVGLPTGLADIGSQRFEAGRLFSHMQRDKKVRDGRLAFILAKRIGEAFISREVAADAVLELLGRAAA
ncbi:MAG: 3-dehydroquinate synthase [Proteobacteria bacterium]|nr:3-dehydroquinate synthase [Pseudomonadota bacterium]MBI3496833.1 3-dehydroquinate synthase [Pseudomonadota bacterium]